MLVAGLTGGIGSGKSTFAAFLAERGAHIIDADQIGRGALRPGTRSWHSVVDQFGDEILAASSLEIDRRRLAAIVFAERSKLAALNAIVHPVLFEEIAKRLEALRDTDAVAVLDAALIIEAGLEDVIDVLVVVIADQFQRTERLVDTRGMTLEEVAARMANQSPPGTLRERADFVVTNNGTLEDLARQADDIWTKLAARVQRR